MTAAFTVGFIVGKVAGHLNDLYFKKKFSGKPENFQFWGKTLIIVGQLRKCNMAFDLELEKYT